MDILAPFVERLLEQGKVVAAIAFVLVAVGVAAIAYYLLTRRKASGPPTARSGERGQTTQVTDVRTKGDVEVSPTQRHGP